MAQNQTENTAAKKAPGMVRVPIRGLLAWLLSPGTLTLWLCGSLLVLFPLYFNNGYLDIVNAKFLYFILHIAVYLFLLAIGVAMRKAGAFYCANNPQKNHAGINGKQNKHKYPKIHPADAAMLAFAAACLVATLCSPYTTTAVWGLNGRSNGLVLYLGCVALYFCVSCLVPLGRVRVLVGLLIAGGSAVALLGVANHFGWDPLGMYYGMDPTDKHVFLSTVGNINFLSTYLCLVAAPALYGALVAKQKRAALLYTAGYAAACLGLLSANSDSGLVALAAVWLMVCCLPGFTGSRLWRALSLLALFFGCCGVLGVLERLTPGKAHELRSVTALLAHPLLLIAAALFAALALAVRVLMRRRPTLGKLRLYIPGRIFAGLVLVAGVYITLAVNAAGWRFSGPGAGALNKIFVLDARWGSNRGYVWGRLWYYFREHIPLGEQLFGSGLDTVNLALNPRYTKYIVAFNGATFDSAHNEYLHYLISVGAVGLLAWLAVCATHLRGLLRREQPPLKTALRLAVFAYIVQAVFNIAMPSGLPLLFLLLGLVRARPADAKSQSKRTLAAPSLTPKQKRTAAIVAVCLLEATLLLTLGVLLPGFGQYMAGIVEIFFSPRKYSVRYSARTEGRLAHIISAQK